MIIEQYSIKDRLNGFIPLQGLPNEPTAKRWFKEMMTTSTVMIQNPDDFTLWYMGTFDTDTGEFISEIKEIGNTLNKEDR